MALQQVALFSNWVTLTNEQSGPTIIRVVAVQVRQGRSACQPVLGQAIGKNQNEGVHLKWPNHLGGRSTNGERNFIK